MPLQQSVIEMREKEVSTQDRPAGGCVVLDLTGPMHTEASEALSTGDGHPSVEAVPWVCLVCGVRGHMRFMRQR